jgi:hypothetical protein
VPGGSDFKREPDCRRRRQPMSSKRMRRIILLSALVVLAMVILASGAEVLDVFDLWSPPDD